MHKSNGGRARNVEAIQLSLDRLACIASNHLAQVAEHYKKKTQRIRHFIANNDMDRILGCGFVMITDAQGNVIKDMGDIFDKPVHIVHAMGEWDCVIKKMK